MGWKNWPSWLKLGISLSVIYIIIAIFAFIFNDEKGILFSIANLPLSEIIQINGLLWYYTFLPILSFVFWFIIGAIIGWLIGKIKK
ncbi:MAG: hypothetical protein WC584_02475 [Candidatus Pacearchaeota archaeon]